MFECNPHGYILNLWWDLAKRTINFTKALVESSHCYALSLEGGGSVGSHTKHKACIYRFYSSYYMNIYRDILTELSNFKGLRYLSVWKIKKNTCSCVKISKKWGRQGITIVGRASSLRNCLTSTRALETISPAALTVANDRLRL